MVFTVFLSFTVTDILCNALFLQLQHRVGIPVFFLAICQAYFPQILKRRLGEI